mgnify:FL=1
MGWQIEREDFMNRYKMITICSLSIVCMLILSLLLPLTTSANDEESIKLKLHYEKSTVTANIAVNSKIYTGVVCKYIEVDNVLEYDDLEYQTKENGQTLNLNKLENDNYTTTIENVSKRYIVVYVSIGNCSICDYIDSKKDTTQETEKTETKKDENSKTEQENNQQNTTAVSENSITGDSAKNGEGNGTTTVNEIESVPDNTIENIEEIPEVSTPSTETPKTENETTPATPAPEPEVPSTNVENTTSKSEENTKNNTSTTTKTQEPTQNSNNNSNNKNTAIVDKDSINPDEFEEIETVDKTKTASTVDSKMPQTGENDTAKFVGIIVFSIIGLISFYKYKESCKKALE